MVGTSYKAAFDSPISDRLYATTFEFGIPEKLIRICKMALSNAFSSVKERKVFSEPFNSERSFRQADLLLSDLFNFLREGILRRAGVHWDVTIFTKSVQLFAYANDIENIGHCVRNITASFAAMKVSQLEWAWQFKRCGVLYASFQQAPILLKSWRSSNILAPPSQQQTVSAWR